MGNGAPTYFIADIAANHDGVLDRAIRLINLAKDAGADAAKFQNFRAPKIVSDYGFRALGTKQSHQAKWKKSVYKVYEDASLPWDWTEKLRVSCEKIGIHFLSTPYDLEAVDMLDPHVPAFKIGSGDITWTEILNQVASKGKPVILSTGASDMGDVVRAVRIIKAQNDQLVLLQCNTNYTGDPTNMRYVQLNVIKTFASIYPDVVLGLSDHIPGYVSVLGAISLGARVIEKHFTDDRSRGGPDHQFSESPASWREMVSRSRELEAALGDSDKYVMENEKETVVLQRRCLRAAMHISSDTLLTRQLIDVLRPAPLDAIMPYEVDRVIGRRTKVALNPGEELTWEKLG